MAEPHKISENQALVFAAIVGSPGISKDQIAEVTGMRTVSVSHAIAGLYHKAMIVSRDHGLGLWPTGEGLDTERLTADRKQATHG